MAKRRFSKTVENSAKDLVKARKERSTLWHNASIIGIGGWLFVLPVVGGAYLGWYLDKKVPIGISWTITLIILGIISGLYNLWFYFRGSGK